LSDELNPLVVLNEYMAPMAVGASIRAVESARSQYLQG